MYGISVVIPALNEEGGIRDIIERTLSEKKRILLEIELVDKFETLVVNDGSTDRTADIVSSYSDEVILIKHDRNRGYGAALKTGFEAASGNLIAFYDADGTYPPESLGDLIEKMIEEDADIVIGSRMAGGITGMPFPRRLGNKFFAYLLSWIVERKITDTASGMRVFKKDILPQLYPLPDGLDLTPAMSTRALHEDLNVVEIPIAYSERTGSSKLNVVTDGIRFLRTIIGVANRYNPLKFFGLAGLLMVGLGFLLSIDPVYYYISVRRVEDTEIYRLFTIMVLFVTGMNVISFGAFSNYVLSIVHHKELNSKSILGRYLLNRSVVKRFDVIGLALIIASIVLNHETIYQYATTKEIYVHWSYILTGATFFLVGVQLVMASFLIKVLGELDDRWR